MDVEDIVAFMKLEIADRSAERRARKRQLTARTMRIAMALYRADVARGTRAGMDGKRRDWSEPEAWHQGYLSGRLIRQSLLFANYETKA